METITHLHVFDFDETLVRAPSFAAKKQVESKDLKFAGPYDFYDHPKSLCEDSYNLQLISPIYAAWQQASRLEDNYTSLVTHRVSSLEQTVKSVLSKRGITMDRYFFLGRVKEKIVVLNEMIGLFPNLKEVSVYEDSIQQLDRYQTYFNYRDGITAKLYFVDKSRVYRIQGFGLSNEQQIRLI
jgi:hypothetical protein